MGTLCLMMRDIFIKVVCFCDKHQKSQSPYRVFKKKWCMAFAVRFSSCIAGPLALLLHKACNQRFLLIFHLSWFKWGRGFVNASLVSYAAAQTSLFEVQWTSVFCCTVVLYTTVQTVQSRQTLEPYSTEQLYACVAVHKLLKAK